MSDSNKKTSPSSKDPPLAQKVFYTMMIADDMRTNIKFFFQHEISDLRKYTRHIFNFCRSRSEYLTQAQIYMFLETETPAIVKELSPENLRRFADLCCQQVERYQDGVLIKRPYKPGKFNKWKNSKYTQYEANHAVDQKKIMLTKINPFIKRGFLI